MAGKMQSHPVGAKAKFQSDPFNWQKAIRHKVPTLLEVGRTPPKCVLSFGGAGFLVTYSLGVAMFLQKERPKLLAESYLQGAGTGAFAVLALACGPEHIDIEKMRDTIIQNRFPVWKEEKRQQVIRDMCEKHLPDKVAQLLGGRACITVGMSMRDSGYYMQEPHNQLYGAQIPTFDDKADVTELLLAATAPNNNRPYKFRGMPVMRGTQRSISSQLDPFVRHVYIHGLAGTKSNVYKHHRVLIGRHGCLANTHQIGRRQQQLAAYPFLGGEDALRQAFDDGYHDARRYERWEEDPYHYAKADRSPGEDTDWRDVRAAIFGDGSENKGGL